MSHPSTASRDGIPPCAPDPSAPAPAVRLSAEGEPILCEHCGRTASNGISCEGYCVADSGY